ncbi:MAG: hypothetical protein P4L84_05890 [Isosphaeraceae bacterium]|nr:hypothetical protein [Isosphaeraceae bacterium]
MAMSDGDLEELASRFQSEYEGFLTAATDALDRKLRLGELLVQARQMCTKRGTWRPFLERVGLADKERFVSECIRFAANRPQIEEAKRNGGSANSVTDVRVLLATPKALPAPKIESERPAQRARAPQSTEEVKRAELAHELSADSENLEPSDQVVEEATDQLEEFAENDGATAPERALAAEEAREDVALPDGVGADEPPTTVGRAVADRIHEIDAPMELSEEEWLRSLPARANLENPALFDDDARLYRMVQPHLDAIAEACALTPEQIRHSGSRSLARNKLRLLLGHAAHILPPDQWPACDQCGGRFTDLPNRNPCASCEGSGFLTLHASMAPQGNPNDQK